MKDTDITEDDLRKAIQEALVKPSPGFLEGETTAPAQAKKHNISQPKAKKIMEQLADEGVLVREKIYYTDPWGDRMRVKGYKLVVKE